MRRNLNVRTSRFPSPRAVRSRGRPKVHSDEEQTGAIAEIAWALLLEKGYGGTAMSDVARAASVSLRTVYRLFPSKPALFAAVVDRHRSHMLRLPGDYDTLPLQVALERIFLVDIAPDEDRARQALMKLLIVEGRQYPELAALVRMHGAERAMALLAQWLQRQVDLGRADVPHPEVTAKMLMDVVFGAVSLKSGDELQWPGGTDRATYLRRCIAVLVAGLAPRRR